MLEKCSLIFILYLYLCFSLFQPTAAKTDFELQFVNFSCHKGVASGNPFERFNCGLNKNIKRRTLHMDFTLLEAFKDFEFHIDIVMPRRPVDFVLLNLTIDGCQFLANKNQVPLMQLAREILDRYSNFPTQCPFLVGKTYYIRAFRLDLSLIPALTMETQVQLQFSYLQRQLPLLHGHIVARVQHTTNAKKKVEIS